MSLPSARRAAILISSLPPEAAARLLATMSVEQRHRVRLETRNLGAISPAERQRTISEFMRSSSKPVATTNSTVAPKSNQTANRSYHIPDFVRGEAKPDFDAQTKSTQSPSSVTPPGEFSTSFEFLSQFDDDVLECALNNEPPHAIAVVLANVHAPQAARLLTRMPQTIREQVVQRLHRISHVTPDTLTDIGEHLKQTLAEHSARLHAPGRKALSAILSHLDLDVLGLLSQAIPELESLRPAADSKQPSLAPTESSNDSTHSNNNSPTLRIAPGTETDVDQQAMSRNNGDAPSTISGLTFDDVQNLPATVLRRILAEIDSEAAVLALLGMRVDVAEGVLATLPKRQERQVRRELASLGPLLIRDIDRARNDVVDAAEKLQRVGVLNASRRLTAVA